MVRIHVFVKGDSSDRERGNIETPTKINVSRPNRVFYHFSPIDAEAEVRKQIEEASGRTVIAGKRLLLLS
jgi:hypothetical protein